MSPPGDLDLEERVARLEALLDKAIAKAKLSATGRAILQLLGLKLCALQL